MIRTSFSPNDPVRQAAHFAALQKDIAPWLKDYAAEIERPAVDFWFTKPQEVEPGGSGGPLQS